jgi:hypothetical protein
MAMPAQIDPKLRRRAALLSGLVMPGVGQWLLGRRRLGAATVAVVLLLVALLAVRIFFLVYHGLVPDGDMLAMRITAEVIADIHRRAYTENWPLLAAIIVIWGWSVWDALRR